MDKWEAETKPFRDKIKNAIHIIDVRIEDLEEIKPTSTVTQLLELERHIKEILEED